MSRFSRFRRPSRVGPADRELAGVLVGKLMQAKDEASLAGHGRPVEHDGMVIATTEVVNDHPDDLGIRHRTVFVHLARATRELIPIPWRG